MQVTDMAKNDNLTDFLQDIADTIRAKRGITGSISAQNFATEIAAIEGGGTPTPTPPTPDMPVIGDGKTYLYIKIAAEGRMTVPLYFSQTVANGVTIDWGDGSATQTLSGTSKINTTHTYTEIGEYTISLKPLSSCTLELGHNTSNYCVLGSTLNNGRVYSNMLQAVEIGMNVTSIGSYAFSRCHSLSSIVIPDGVTSIGTYAFDTCYSLSSIVIPGGVSSIGNSAFSNCYGMAFYDFSMCSSIPTLGGSSVFSYIPSDCKIVVPDNLYDSWKAATNWSRHASNMVKASQFNR